MTRANSDNHKSGGFTLVELTLSMAFISMLLLAIAVLTLQISNIYNKGVALRAVNEAGQLLTSNVQRTLSGARQKSVLYDSDSTGGRLCADQTVFAWNFGKDLVGGSNPNMNSLNKYAAGGQKPIRFVRYPAGTVDACTRVSGVLPVVPDTATDLLSSGDVSLQISDFTINKDALGAIGEAVNGDSAQRMYQISMTIGTSEQGIMTSNEHGCEVPKSIADDQYCAVNRFEFTARAGGVTIDE